MNLEKKSFTTIGLMSGTSLDGIDATIVETDGEFLKRYNIYDTYEYKLETKTLLKECLADPYEFINKKNKLEILNYLITIDHAYLIKSLLKKTRLQPSLLGFHGQTILHNPQKKISIQCGDPSLLNRLTKINTISFFRQQDLLNGGQGAPLAPIYHKFIMKDLNCKLPCCFVNIGGISNLTYWDGNNLIGFDTGPGNVLIDKYTKKFLNKPYDKNGNLGLKGKSNKMLIKRFMKHPFFSLDYPKSLDNQEFLSLFKIIEEVDLDHNDKIATLSDFTAFSIYKSLKCLPEEPKKFVVAGGGLFNKSIINNLNYYLNFPVFTANDIKLNGKLIEAELIAFLAARKINNLPITFPLTTGCKEPTIGGKTFLN